MRKNRSIITLGSFDGVHRGHQAILKKVVDRARALKAVPAALVFGIPPRFVKQNTERRLLTTLAEKKELVRRLGMQAAHALGYTDGVAGRVIRGDRRGRALGFPTANIEVDPGKIVPPGVFWVYVPSLRLHGVCNVGTRPTFTPGETKRHVEVFLFGAVGTLYRRRLALRFLRRVRPEKRFASAAALVRQIKKDVAQVQKWRKTVALHTVLHSI
jgi:FAD synthase